MNLKEFKALVNKTLQKKLPVDMDDLPDVDLSNYFDEDFTEDECKSAAEECVSDLLDDMGYNEDE